MGKAMAIDGNVNDIKLLNEKSLHIGIWILLIDKILTTMLPIVFLCLMEVFWLTFEGPLDTCRYKLWRLLQYTLVGYVHCSAHDWCISLARELGIEIATPRFDVKLPKAFNQRYYHSFYAIHAPSIANQNRPKLIRNDMRLEIGIQIIISIIRASFIIIIIIMNIYL